MPKNYRRIAKKNNFLINNFLNLLIFEIHAKFFNFFLSLKICFAIFFRERNVTNFG